MSDLIRIEREGTIARLWLNRPEAHNALSPALVSQATEALIALAAEPPRVLVLAGAGPSFCAGADIKWLDESASLSMAEVRDDALALIRLLDAIAGFPAPVVARVHGTVAGGGNGLVAAADIAVAAQNAMFVFSEVRLGIVPAVIAPYVVRRIGTGRATSLWMTAERFDGAAAERHGLVHGAVPEDELDESIAKTIALLLAGGPIAQLEARALARLASAGPGPALAGETAALNARLRLSPEGREGLRAFLERRKPAWSE